MKNTLTTALLFFTLFISSACFSQTVINKTLCVRTKGTEHKEDLISSYILLTAERLDSVKICRWAEHLFGSLNFPFYDKNYSMLFGGNADSLYSFTILMGHNQSGNTFSIFISNSSAKGIIVTDAKAKEIINIQKNLAERIIKEIQSL